MTNEIETQVVNEEGINWDLFSSNYVRLLEGEPIDLVLKNWRQTEEEYKGESNPGIRMDVIEENGAKVEKMLVITSRRLATAVRPLITNAEKMGEPTLKVRVLRSGTGFSTQYSVKALT